MEVLKQGAAEPLPAEVILAGFNIAVSDGVGGNPIATKLEVLNTVDQEFLRYFFDFSIPLIFEWHVTALFKPSFGHSGFMIAGFMMGFFP